MTRLAPSPPLLDPTQSLTVAMLDALPGRVGLLDAVGRLVRCNAAWRSATLEGPDGAWWVELGDDFLLGLDQCRREHCTRLTELRQGLGHVLAGETPHFSLAWGDTVSGRQMLRANALSVGNFHGVLLCFDDVSVVDDGDAALQRFRGAIETSTDAIYLVDRNSLSFIDVNSAACRLVRKSRAELMATGPASVHGIDPVELAELYDRVIAAGDTAEPTMIHGLTPEGERFFLELRRRPLHTAEGWVIVTTTRDVTSGKTAERGVARAARQQALIARFGKLALSSEPLQLLYDRAAAIVAEGLHIDFAEVSQTLPDGKGLVLVAAAGFERNSMGHAMATAGGPLTVSARVLAQASPVTASDLDPVPPPQCGLLTHHKVRSSLGVPIPGPHGPRGVLGAHSKRQWRFNAESIDFMQSVANTLANAIDRAEAEGRLVQLSQYDSLTSLPNRSLLIERLRQALSHAKRHDWRVDVLVLNLDRFKVVNDTLGHAMGDELLMQAALRLKSCLRGSDTVGRLGGDEFAIVLPRPDDAATVVKRVMAAMAQAFTLGSQQVYLSASIGIAVYPADGEDADALLKNADTAMNQAKQRGRNHYLFYEAAMNDRAMERLQLEAQLRDALERDEFLLHYQPKVNLASGEISGFEALLRWQHPTRGMVPPLEFISILEDTGMIVPVGEWVLRTVCRQLARWKTDGLPLRPVAINLSARQFLDKGLEDIVRKIVAEEGTDPNLLEFELTESMLMADAESAARTLASLKAYGVRLSVDDFGTGYSSLAYLKRFPIDALKIDRSFMRDVTTDNNDASIALAIIRLAHSLKLDVVAEGVETEAQMSFLRSHDCDQMQGYYFSRPLAIADCTRALSEGRTLRDVASTFAQLTDKV